MSAKELQNQLTDLDPEDFGKEVYSSGWVSNGKYDLIETVIKVEHNFNDGIDTGYYRCTNSRSGSYFTAYEYGDWNVEKVEPYTETVEVTKYRSIE